MSCAACEELIPRMARERREASAALRALEAATGTRATDDTGRYWLARTAAFEQLHVVTQRYLEGRASRDELASAATALDTVPLPACRAGDHTDGPMQSARLLSAEQTSTALLRS
jgi:hypothetical protein